MIGPPEGVRRGVPGDLIYQIDTDTVWLKGRGIGTPFGWIPLGTTEGGCICEEISNEGSVISLSADGVAVTAPSGAQISFRTQTNAVGTELRTATLYLPNHVAPPGTTAFATIDTIAVDGRVSKVDFSATGVDVVDVAAVRSSNYIGGFRRAAGAIAPIVANLFTEEFVGGAGTFAADVTLALAALSPNVFAVTTNGSGADRIGHITCHWTVQQGGVPL